MKLFLTTAALTATLISGMAFASDPVIPWAANSGSIQADEAALTSNKPPVQGHPELMPHQG
ncbi:hypothetical protein [Salmonella enterica]|uniref:Secreted protein n=1 Tax=Salmonella enterica subsp. enterica serovar Napoli TaxID=1151001 RepID=A0A5H6JA01_SALET|nr:hypothetical protein [Salmonella enterica]EBS5959378.1 hypothetical protein [Salmonella enterica subsp. enterica serovar Napoli]EBX4297989.1 hypothetical protein [Salmonella enterica subsp. enterica serovar Napoli]ECD2888697.1 hypothetical protein [Salmonella enterica subsp. enterica serovar Napoli]EIF5756130.1 hypothetical protein [Salmonella enterica subsp. enterica serovar Napoli]KMT42739.1 hypothetical protein ACI06_14905 [Salmonella enterica subsp. enterica serovar Napoli]